MSKFDWGSGLESPQVQQWHDLNRASLAERARGKFALVKDGEFGHILVIACADGRSQWSVATGLVELNGLTHSLIELGILAGAPPETEWVSGYLKWIIKTYNVTMIVVTTHTSVADDLCGCGALGVREALVESQVEAMTKFSGQGLADAARWIESNLHANTNPGVQAMEATKRVAWMVGYEVPVYGVVQDHAKYSFMPVAYQEPCDDPGSRFETASTSPYMFAWNGNKVLDVGILPAKFGLLMEYATRHFSTLEKLAQAQEFGKLQHFKTILLTDVPVPYWAMFGGLIRPDQVFNANILARPHALDVEWQGALEAAMAAFDYGVAHATPDTEVLVVVSNPYRGHLVIDRLMQSPPFRNFMKNLVMQEAVVLVSTPEGNLVNGQGALLKPAYQIVD